VKDEAMIRGFVVENDRLRSVEDVPGRIGEVIWVDLESPSVEEETALEQQLGIEIPSREEMEEIEVSSRLYYEEGAAFMTATLPARTESDDLLMAPVTFVLAGERLITIRYHEPRAFQTFPRRAERVNLGCVNGEAVLVALLEASVDRLADILERVQRDIDAISRNIFQHPDLPPMKGEDLHQVLRDIGRKGDLTSNIRDSLVTLQRLAGFLGHVRTQRRSSKDIAVRVKTLARDIQSLTDHSSFLSQKTTFLLDATLGVINIQQNAIIKIFSIAAVVFLPPTLIASVYGMNFIHMPELGWRFGYAFACLIMLVSGVLPYWYFKRRGWL
jgi:magnesium transporter